MQSPSVRNSQMSITNAIVSIMAMSLVKAPRARTVKATDQEEGAVSSLPARSSLGHASINLAWLAPLLSL